MTETSVSKPPQSWNVDEVMDNARLSPRAIMLTLIFATILIADGFDLVVLGYLAPAVATEFGFSRMEMGWFLTLGHIGVVIGGLLGGPIGDRFGRRPALILAILLFAGATLVCALVADSTLFIIVRIVASIGMGVAGPIVATYMIEILPLLWRNQLTMLAYTAMSLGSLLCALAAKLLLPIADWRAVFAVGGIVPLLVLLPLIVWLVPESPRFLVSSAKPGARIAQTLNRICGGVRFSADDSFALTPRDRGERRFGAIFSKAHLTPLLTLSVVALLVFFSTIGMQNMGSLLLTSVGFSVVDSVSVLLGLNIAGLIGVAAASVVIHRWGSKVMLTCLLSWGTLCMIVLGYLSNQVTPSLTLIGIAFAVTAFGTTSSMKALFPVAAQAFPTAVRSTGSSMVLSIGRVGSTVGPALIAMVLTSTGPSTVFFMLGAALLTAIVISLLFQRHVPPRQSHPAASRP